MVKKTSAKSNSPQLSFEQAIQELESITRDLEGGGLTLDDAIKAYERGVELKKSCQTMLEAAQKKLEFLEQKEDGSFQKVAINENEAAPGATAQNRLFQD